MITEVVDPNLGNFTDSLRDIGYSFEVAVADLIDNSVTAKSSIIKILCVSQKNLSFSLLDNGSGMSERELVEGMRMATKGPHAKRHKEDLGRFGLGLKTASFSQCRKLTVLSKKDGVLSARQWDLDYISKKNAWLLITPTNFKNFELYDELNASKSGTLICWEDIDRINKKDFSGSIERLRKHLSLVFHRFLEKRQRFSPIKIYINNNKIIPFDPFNIDHPATQQAAAEKVVLFGSTVNIQPFILPHHSKISQQEYELYATEEGYIKSQGFYLYRGNRILVYGTWWGLHRSIDAHKLVRIKIDIPNDLDVHWGIDIKKSIAQPCEEIKNDLKRIINQITEKGSRPYTGRGRKIEDKNVVQFWEIVGANNDFRFAINQNHPIYKDLVKTLSKEAKDKLTFFLKGLQAYLPLEAIQSRLQKSPHQIKQETALTDEEIIEITDKLLASGLTKQYIDDLLKTEIFINRKELLRNGHK
jgi:hypothetical protein